MPAQPASRARFPGVTVAVGRARLEPAARRAAQQRAWTLALALALTLLALVALDGCQSPSAPASADPSSAGPPPGPGGGGAGAEEAGGGGAEPGAEGDEVPMELGEIELDGEMISVDGLEVREMHCELAATDEQAGGMAMLDLVATLADHKAAIDACAPNGAAFRVALSFAEGGAQVQVTAAAGPQSAPACIDAALSAIEQVPSSGRCTAVLMVGAPGPAAEAAESLLGTPAEAP